MTSPGEVPIEKWVEEIIKRTVAEHIASCPLRGRVEKVELRFASLLAFMTGSGMLGGVGGALISRLLLGG